MNGEVDDVALDSDGEILDTVECDCQYCEKVVYTSATVDVVVGKKSEIKRNKGVEKVFGPDEQREPKVETWCIDCAEREFSVTSVAGKRDAVEEYINPKIIASFMSGVLLTALVMSIIAV